MIQEVLITQTVLVEIDQSKFDEAFLKEFRDHFYNFRTIDDHLKHLGQLYARGLVDNNSFIEGYGPAKDMGIKFEQIEIQEDLQ
jgi:hypothetical protein